MNSEWEWKRLGDHCIKIGSGSTPKGGKDGYLEHGPFTLIRSQNVYNDGFTPNGLAYIGEDQAKKLDGVSVEKNDVLLNITGDSVARVCLAPSRYLPARVNQHVAIIRPNGQSFDSRFLRYFLASPIQQDLMLGLASAGATRPALTKGMIEAFKIPCPPLEVQRWIADVLSSLEDRIALLREINTTLEAIAQALFKSWFVDFDPVRAKQGGRKPEGMDSANAALFPDSFEESELGMMPRGWRVGSLNEICNISSGKRPRDRSDVQAPSAEIPLYGGAGIMGFTSDSLFDKPKILTGRVGTLGKVHMVDPPFWASDNVLILSPTQKIYFIFNFLWLKEIDVIALNRGSTQPLLTQKDLGSQKRIIPSDTALMAFEMIAELTYKRVRENEKQAQTLATLRDTLLPRLISGQLRLPEAETMLEKVAA
jgi:type I restriction enzyme S subunit